MLPVIRRKSFVPGFVDEFFGKDFLADFFDDRTGISMPAVNILESKDEFKLEIAAPGLTKKDYRIQVENNVLTISSEKEEKKEEKETRFMRREFSYNSFSRSFTLPQTVAADQITANYSEGVLTIVIPKKEEAKEKPAREIKIS
ncbi:MAG: Hsp20/alpha crystallin family protein [Bacteroidales bacterium]|nr:Hsp20/alpha crystallin family protein [Lentimicrobiaceae bacterium]MDD5693845.1 Hsp20/alpha crystallin family protein [Bacteroidales bacterium]